MKNEYRTELLRLLRKTATSLREQRFRDTFLKIYIKAVDYLFDIKYKTDTYSVVKLDQLTISSENKIHSYRYEPSRVAPLRKLFKAIQPIIPTDGIFVDFGCGKGRVLLLASEAGLKKVRGVEFAKELCEIARVNCNLYQRKTYTGTEFQIIEEDATQYDISKDENVFFIFNSFKAEVLKKVFSNIYTSFQKYPRKILIIYHNPKHEDAIDKWDNLVRLQKLNFWNYYFVLFSITTPTP